jgi:hypothetical protein
MELILLVVIAGLAGYWLSQSRFSKSIDEAAGNVSDSSRNAANQASGWFSNLFGRKPSAEEIVDVEFENETEAEVETSEASDVDEVKPAAKTTSRRKSTTGSEEEQESEE